MKKISDGKRRDGERCDRVGKRRAADIETKASYDTHKCRSRHA
jgi:hypothetical protein